MSQFSHPRDRTNGHHIHPHAVPGDPTPDDQRTLYDYWAMLRERIWGFLTISLTIFSASIIYVATTTELYTGVSKLQILRDDTRCTS